MDRNKTLAKAAALVMTVTGGVSALFLTVGAADTPTSPDPATEVVQYVDAAGNPIPATSAGVASRPSTGAQVAASVAPTSDDDHDDDHDRAIAPVERHEEEDHD